MDRMNIEASKKKMNHVCQEKQSEIESVVKESEKHKLEMEVIVTEIKQIEILGSKVKEKILKHEQVIEKLRAKKQIIDEHVNILEKENRSSDENELQISERIDRISKEIIDGFQFLEEMKVKKMEGEKDLACLEVQKEKLYEESKKAFISNEKIRKDLELINSSILSLLHQNSIEEDKFREIDIAHTESLETTKFYLTQTNDSLDLQMDISDKERQSIIHEMTTIDVIINSLSQVTQANEETICELEKKRDNLEKMIEEVEVKKIQEIEFENKKRRKEKEDEVHILKSEIQSIQNNILYLKKEIEKKSQDLVLANKKFHETSQRMIEEFDKIKKFGEESYLQNKKEKENQISGLEKEIAFLQHQNEDLKKEKEKKANLRKESLDITPMKTRSKSKNEKMDKSDERPQNKNTSRGAEKRGKEKSQKPESFEFDFVPLVKGKDVKFKKWRNRIQRKLTDAKKTPWFDEEMQSDNDEMIFQT